jgi:alpha-glucosidase
MQDLPAPSPRTWWHHATFYQVYIRSFADSDGDGVGDIGRIRARLPYRVNLGVDAIWINPFYPSPEADHGYDVADYMDIEPEYGTLVGFDALVEDAHGRGLKVILDIVPHHTSDRHRWFQNALSSRDHPDRAKYYFADPGPDGGPPYNWTSAFGGPAWTLDENSGQYYLHLFAPEQPDLNWCEPSVNQEFEGILRFWFDRGVDGFRIDVADLLYKEHELPNSPSEKAPRAGATGPNYEFRIGDQEEVHEV